MQPCGHVSEHEKDGICHWMCHSCGATCDAADNAALLARLAQLEAVAEAANEYIEISVPVNGLPENHRAKKLVDALVALEEPYPKGHHGACLCSKCREVHAFNLSIAKEPPHDRP